MTANGIRRMLKEQPFQPFRMHLVSGHEVAIRHHEFMLIPPMSRAMLFIVDEDGYGEIINSTIIERITFENGAKRRSNGTRSKSK
jgi:hypothetical protein